MRLNICVIAATFPLSPHTEASAILATPKEQPVHSNKLLLQCTWWSPDIQGILPWSSFTTTHRNRTAYSFLLQADSTRLTPAVLLNSAPVWAEDVQWKLNLRHLGPERANHCTDSLCIQILNHSLRTREGGSEEELIKKEELFLTAFIPEQSYWALLKVWHFHEMPIRAEVSFLPSQ